MITLKTKIGNSMIEYEGQDFKQVCKFSALVGEIPRKCSLCGSEDVYLYHKSPKGNDYFGVKCGGCGAEQNFHQRKEGGFYIKWDDKFEKYGGAEKQGADDFDDDIPI